jgi:integrase
VASIRTYATKRGETRHEVRWRDAAGRDASRSFTAERDALRFKADIESRQQLGPLYQAKPERLGAFLDGWLERYEVSVRRSTYNRAVQALRVWEPFLAARIDQLRAGALDDHVAAYARKAPRQAQLALAKLKQALSDARDRGQRVDDAIFRLRPPRLESRTPRFLTWVEVKELSAWCSEGRLVMVAALTGLREGELFALVDTRVDLARRSIVVDASASAGSGGRTKSASGVRRVRLSRLGVEILDEQLRSRVPNEAGLVFPSPTGSVWHAGNFMRRVFRPARERAGLSEVTFHDLRHTYASLMILAGNNPLVIAKQLGHRDARLVFERYGHLYPGEDEAAADALDTVTGGAVDVGQEWDAWGSAEVESGESPVNDRWSVPGSNRRPPACKAGALPAELTPREGQV